MDREQQNTFCMNIKYLENILLFSATQPKKDRALIKKIEKALIEQIQQERGKRC